MTPVAANSSRVQVTVVAGPPVEIQVRVNAGEAAVRSDVRLNSSGSVMVGAPEVEGKVTVNARSFSGKTHMLVPKKYIKNLVRRVAHVAHAHYNTLCSYIT